jgi:Spy/CpxP family protein refolding chaperone
MPRLHLARMMHPIAIGENTQRSNTMKFASFFDSCRRNTRVRKVLIGGAAASLLGIGALAAHAEPGSLMHAHMGGHHRGSGFAGDPAEMADHMLVRIDHMLSRIGASEDQKTRIKAIAKSAVTDLAPLRKQQWDLRKQMHDAFAAPTIDKAKLAELHKQQTQLFEKTSARMHEAMIAGAEILTPEQRKAMAERMGRRGMRGMGPQS